MSGRTPASSVVCGALEAIWIGLRYGEMVTHAERGIRAIHELDGQLRPVLETIRRQAPPPSLARLCGEALGALDILAVHTSTEGASSRKVLVADQALRRDYPMVVRQLLDLVGELDATYSASSLLPRGYILPDIVENGSALLEGEGVWHPFLPEAVRNPVSLSGGETLVFLTGPNMAGKSTYLRAVEVCIYLAHCGLPVPAAALRFAPVESLSARG